MAKFMRYETLLLIVGMVFGFCFGRTHASPEDMFGKLASTTYECNFCCGKQGALPVLKDGAACTVTVVRQYCRIIDYPTPHQVCVTTREDVPGIWNESRGCCQATVRGMTVCVKARS